MEQAEQDLHTSALETIGRRIIAGDYPAGSPLDLDALGRDVQAGRSVIREALRVLGAMGLIKAWPKRGTFVEPRSRWNWLDPSVLRWYCEIHQDFGFFDSIAEMREIFEPGVVRLAVRRRTEAQLAGLRRYLDQMSTSDVASDDFIEADVNFHRLILECAGNEFLMQYASATEVGLRAQHVALRTHDRLELAGRDTAESLARHRALYEAILHRSPEDAEVSMRRVLEQARDDLSRARHSSNAKSASIQPLRGTAEVADAL
jgi:DNA-binding FadR family transcriptional regulator